MVVKIKGKVNDIGHIKCVFKGSQENEQFVTVVKDVTEGILSKFEEAKQRKEVTE